MSQFPNPVQYPLLPNMSIHGMNGMPISRGGGVTSTAWPSANLAVFMPFRINMPLSFNAIAIDNGATLSGNIDLGVYSVDGTRLVSVGGTAQIGSANTPKTYTVTQTGLASGVYYMAVAIDNTTATLNALVFNAVALGQMIPFLGMAQMATAYPLPATATFASNTNNIIPVISILNRSFL